MAWDDDIHLGNYSEIGESLRGMQDSSVGAAQALRQLRGALGTLAQNRFGAHAPVSKQMRSPYKDSTQIGILITTGDITPSAWVGSPLPTFSGLTRVYKSFKPTKAILTELVTLKFTNAGGGPDVILAKSVSDAADLVLVSAFSGADNCFPNAPTEANGISGPTFANNSLGNGISWPTLNGGIDMTVAFAIENTVQFSVATPPPFNQTPYVLSTVNMRIRFNLLGPSLR
jgi:hypothetical protein